MSTSTEQSHSTAVRAILIVLAAIVAGPLAMVAFISSGLATTLAAATAAANPPFGGGQLNIDAIPAHARYLAPWVVRAGSLCPQITPPMIAAQIDLESSWRADAVAHNPPDSGGDAIGIAQFQLGTWATWGGDYDHDGRNAPDDPEDAIYAMGRLMCDLVAWAKRGIGTGILSGAEVDIAWAAYFCGRGCILAAGGVPAAGLAHDYPQQVRSRIDKYSIAAGGGTGAWRLPLPTWPHPPARPSTPSPAEWSWTPAAPAPTATRPETRTCPAADCGSTSTMGAGSAPATATRCGSTCRPAPASRLGSSSPGSAPPATPPARTCTWRYIAARRR